MNKILCFISGGHRYSSKNLFVDFDSSKKYYIFRNTCVKCGHERKDYIPKEDIEQYMRAEE